MKIAIEIGVDTEAALRIEAAETGDSLEGLAERIVRDHAAHPHVRRTLADFMADSEYSLREGYAKRYSQKPDAQDK